MDAHQTIVVVDIEGSGDATRTARNHMVLRADLLEVVTSAFTSAGFDLDSSYRQNEGDGMLLLLPADVSKRLLVALLPAALADVLRRHNVGRAEEETLRLRMAIHAGEVPPNQHGVASKHVSYSRRIANVAEAQFALRQSGGSLAVVVSDWFYQEVIRHGPERYLYRRITVPEIDMSEPAWLWLPFFESSTTRRSTYASDVPVLIYVSNGLVHPEVASAVEDLLAFAGLLRGVEDADECGVVGADGGGRRNPAGCCCGGVSSAGCLRWSARCRSG